MQGRKEGEAMNITKKEMQFYGHKDEWGVDCLYLGEAQNLFAVKLLEAAKLSRAEVEAFEDRMKGRLS
jgi:hypothetical protein